MAYYVSPVNAYVSRLGYIYCPPCGEGRDDILDTYTSDNCAVEGEHCDACTAELVYDPRLRVRSGI